MSSFPCKGDKVKVILMSIQMGVSTMLAVCEGMYILHVVYKFVEDDVRLGKCRENPLFDGSVW